MITSYIEMLLKPQNQKAMIMTIIILHHLLVAVVSQVQYPVIQVVDQEVVSSGKNICI